MRAEPKHCVRERRELVPLEQACGLSGLLRNKVQDWAEVSDGLFPLRYLTSL